MRSNPPFPQEVTERIIDCASDSAAGKNLKSFSLVSRAWLPRSRFHLFRRLRVIISDINSNALDSLLHCLRCSAAGRRFLSFLPAVDFVQELQISDPFRTASPTEGRTSHGPFPTLVFILRMLPYLRVLEIDMKISAPQQCPANILHSFNPRRLKRLGLSVDSDVRCILPLFSSIATLSISSPVYVNVDQPGSIQVGSTQRGGYVQVERAVITARVLRSEYASALKDIGSKAAVQHLTVECEMMQDWKVLGYFLRSEGFARGLQSLTIDMRSCDLSRT